MAKNCDDLRTTNVVPRDRPCCQGCHASGADKLTVVQLHAPLGHVIVCCTMLSFLVLNDQCVFHENSFPESE